MMKEIALHLLDIAENSVSAQASAVEIMVCEDLHADRLEVQIKDNGKGMPAETARQLGDPFYTTRTTRKVGLGIPLFQTAAQACNGSLIISSQPGMGTTIQVDFQHSHIDRMPLGDYPATCLALLIAHPEVNWRFIYRQRSPGSSQADEFIFDDAPIKEILDGVSLCEPDVLGYLRQALEEGVGAITSSAQAVRYSLVPN